MNKDDLENLSSSLDEHGADERFVGEIGRNKDMSECWRRYCLIGEVMRHNTAPITDPSFPLRVMSALESEPFHHSKHSITDNIVAFPAWVKRVAGVAIAATVALTVVTLLPTGEREQEQIASHDTIKPKTVLPVSPAVHTPAAVIPQLTMTTRELLPPENLPEPDYNPLDIYVLRHSAAASMQNTLPFARIVRYYSEK